MLELFETPLTVLHIFVCFFLILVVLIQPGKSGGLGAALGGAGAQQVFGGRGAGNFLSRATWICASTFFVTSMVLAYISSSADDSLQDRSGRALSTKRNSPQNDEVVVPAAPFASAPAQGDEANEPAAADIPAAEAQPSAEAVTAEQEPAEQQEPADNAAPAAVSAAAEASSAVPSPAKPVLLSTTTPVAPKPPAQPVAPAQAAPATSVVTSPAVVPAPAGSITPPAPNPELPRRSVPPSLPLQPAPAASN